jgi:hypothetical protein
MLSENDRYAVQTFQSKVVTLEQMLLSEFDSTTLKTELSSFQNLFQAEIQAIQTENYRVRSVLVEIDKQMRLLKMNAMFLQTARQSETAQQRVNQLRDRCQLLKNYCDVLLGSPSD